MFAVDAEELNGTTMPAALAVAILALVPAPLAAQATAPTTLALVGVAVGIAFLASARLRTLLTERILPVVIPARLRALARAEGATPFAAVLTVFEALAMGKAILATDADGLLDVTADREAPQKWAENPNFSSVWDFANDRYRTQYRHNFLFPFGGTFGPSSGDCATTTIPVHGRLANGGTFRSGTSERVDVGDHDRPPSRDRPGPAGAVAA